MRKLLSLAALMLIGASPMLSADEEKNVNTPQFRQRNPRRRKSPQSPDKFRRGQGIWRAFSQLSDTEKKEMLKLQRNDPDKFRKIMQEKADRLYQETLARRRQREDIAAQIRECKDEKRSAQLRTELQEMIKADMLKHLEHSRRNLEQQKARISKMEAELKKRESNLNDIVNAVTDNMISGKRPPKPPKKQRP